MAAWGTRYALEAFDTGQTIQHVVNSRMCTQVSIKHLGVVGESCY